MFMFKSIIAVSYTHLYDKAVDKVAEETKRATRKDDIRLAEDSKRWIQSPERKASRKEKPYLKVGYASQYLLVPLLLPLGLSRFIHRGFAFGFLLLLFGLLRSCLLYTSRCV